jgi:hypothetical protein
MFILSVNDYRNDNMDNIFLFGFVDNKWKFLESLEKSLPVFDAKFTQ